MAGTLPNLEARHRVNYCADRRPLSLLQVFGCQMAFVGGAVLASTDPVLLREIAREPRLTRSVRQVLKIEAGMNDIVVSPVILVLIAVIQAQGLDI